MLVELSVMEQRYPSGARGGEGRLEDRRGGTPFLENVLSRINGPSEGVLNHPSELLLAIA